MPGRLLAECGSALGLLLILCACYGINKTLPFPGRWALFPTLGAALVILFASPVTLTGRLLSTRILVGVGLISYSAYLWHWPLFVFARIAIEKPSLWAFTGLSALSLGLAFISWRYVERPFRDRQLFQRPQIFRFAAVGATLLVIVGCVGLNGIPSRFNAEDADLLVSHQERTRWVTARHDQLKGINHFSGEKKLRVLLLGDSFSEDFMNILGEVGLLSDAEIRVRYIPFSCQIYLDKENGMNFIEEKDSPFCTEVYGENFYPSLQPVIQDANIIIFVAAWKEWAARRFPETVKNLDIPDLARVIVINRKYFGTIRRRDYIGLLLHEKTALRNRVDDSIININEILSTGLKAVSNVEFIDLYGLICGMDSRTCPVFSPDGKLLSHDGNHLTQAGAAYIGRLLKQHPVFKALEEESSAWKGN